MATISNFSGQTVSTLDALWALIQCQKQSVRKALLKRFMEDEMLVDETFKGRITFRHAGLSPVDENKKGMLKAQLEHFYYSLLIQGMKKSKKENLSILKQSSGYIRSAIARKVNLRNTPELVFQFDESLEYGSRIDEILKGITKDLKKGE